MFRLSIALLTVVAVLWHTIAGCCAHGESFPPSAGAPSASAKGRETRHAGRCRHREARSHRHAGRDCAHSGSHAPGEPCRGPHRGHSCHELSCAFSLSKPVEPPGPSLLSGLAAVVLDECSQAAVRDARDEDRFLIHPRPPTIRAHLLACVLLN